MPDSLCTFEVCEGKQWSSWHLLMGFNSLQCIWMLESQDDCHTWLYSWFMKWALLQYSAQWQITECDVTGLLKLNIKITQLSFPHCSRLRHGEVKLIFSLSGCVIKTLIIFSTKLKTAMPVKTLKQILRAALTGSQTPTLGAENARASHSPVYMERSCGSKGKHRYILLNTGKLQVRHNNRLGLWTTLGSWF